MFSFRCVVPFNVWLMLELLPIKADEKAESSNFEEFYYKCIMYGDFCYFKCIEVLINLDDFVFSAFDFEKILLC